MINKIIVTLAGVLIGSPFLSAAIIGPNCGTCQGSTYSLSYTPPVTTSGGNEIVDVFLTINASGFSASSGSGPFYIDATSIKISNSLVAGSLISAPSVSTGSWSEIPGGLNANGCDTHGSGFDCAQFSYVGPGAARGAVTGTNNPYTWEFQETISDGSLLTGTNDASIKLNM